MAYKAQSPQDLLDWAIDFETNWLADGDSITAYAWSIDPDSSPSHLTNATSANVKVDNLSWGIVYRLTLKVTSVNGIEGTSSIALRCGDL